ncbi:MAG: DUF1573 domain-containing protein [Muribaculaceae bacterium]|nr:DUF1573 domain-containing protein [Muribaculaceae bacterium]
MKKLHLFFFLLLFLSVLPLEAKTKVEWLNTEYDFGLIQESNGPVEGLFRFVNKGGKPVYIREVKPSCGCTSVNFTQGQIKKGDVGEIRVTFDAENRPGKFDKGIHVFLKDEAMPINLRIEGTVIASPETLQLFYPIERGNLHFDTDTIKFGEMKRGLRRKEYIDIYNSGTEPLTPHFSSASNALRMELEPTTIPPGEGGLLTIYLDSSQVMGLGERTLSLKGEWDNEVVEITAKVKLVP